MIEDSTDALEQALALYATPARLPSLLKRPLPRAVLLLIRIAAGDSGAIATASERAAEPRRVIVEAAVLYIQQVLFHECADSYRVLGVPADAGRDTVKEHYRWLMHWLHPDRHPERWEVVYSERVNRAWNSLNSEQRRQDYDAHMHSLARAAEMNAGISRSRGVRRVPNLSVRRGVLSPRVIRRLPILVLGGLALVSMMCLGTLIWIQRHQGHADVAGSRKIAYQAAVDESSAQEEVIRRRMAFEEHVIELSQPILPSHLPATDPSVLSDPIKDAGLRRTPAAPSVGALADARLAIAEATPPTAFAGPSVSTPPTAASVLPEGRTVALKTNAESLGSTSRSSLQGSPMPQPPSAKLFKLDASSGLSGAGQNTGHPIPGSPRMTTPKSVPLVAEPNHASVAPRNLPESPAVAAPSLQTAKASGVLTQASRTQSSEVANSQLAGHVAHATTAAAANASPYRVSPEQATTVVPREFEDAYSKGDITQLMRLFSPDAVENEGGIEAIREDYGHLFRNASVHELRLDALHWRVLQPNLIVGSGSFEARIRHNDEQIANSVRGWIQIEAVPMNGIWKIQRVQYRNAE